MLHKFYVPLAGLLCLQSSTYAQTDTSGLHNIQLNEFVFSGNKFSENKKNIAQPLQVINRKQIEWYSPQTSATMLEQTGNVFMQRSQMGGGSAVLRGFEANKVLMVVDGVRMNNAIFRGGHLQNILTIDNSILNKVEVLFGPSSVIYGSDALGGVLYLNPERYADADSTEVDAGVAYYTNTLGTEANLGVKTSLENFKFLVRGNYATHSDYETGNGQRAGNSRFSEADLKTGIGYRDRKYKADLRYNLNSSSIGIPDGLGSSTSKEVLEPYQEIDNHILSLDNTFYFDNSSLDVKLGYLYNDRKEFEEHHHHEEEHEEGHEEEHPEASEPHSEEAALQMKLRTVNYDAKYHFPKMGDFETIIGVQGMYQINKNLGEEFLIPDATTTDVGVLATTHYHLDKFDFQAGIRFDNRRIASEAMGTEDGKFIEGLDRSFNSYNGAFGVKMDVLPEITARLNLATGFRAPNLAELTSLGSHHGSNRYEIGNPDLENERNYQLDLALEWRNDHFEIFGNAFYNSIDNYIYLRPSGEVLEENPVYNYVQNNAELYGGEAGIHIHPHPLDWLHLESSFEMVVGRQGNGDYLPLIPAHSVTNTFRMEFGELEWMQEGYSFISLKSTFSQEKVNPFEDTSSGYSLLSAGLGGNFDFLGTDLELQVSGKNLLDKEYTAHLSRLKSDGIPNMGRNIVLSLKFAL